MPTIPLAPGRTAGLVCTIVDTVLHVTLSMRNANILKCCFDINKRYNSTPSCTRLALALPLDYLVLTYVREFVNISTRPIQNG